MPPGNQPSVPGITTPPGIPWQVLFTACIMLLLTSQASALLPTRTNITVDGQKRKEVDN